MAISSPIIDLALGDGARAGRAADREHRRARLLGGAAPMDMAASRHDVALERLEIEIEMREHVVLDRARLVAQRLELRAAARPPWRAARRSPGAS